MQWASVHFKNSELQWSALHCILIDCTEVLEQRLEELLVLTSRCSAAVQYFHRGAWVVGAGGLVISDQVTKGPTIPPNLRLYFRPSKKLKLKLIISVKVSNECKKGGQRHFFLPSKCWVGNHDQIKLFPLVQKAYELSQVNGSNSKENKRMLSLKWKLDQQ